VAILADLQRVTSRRSDRVLFEGLSLTISDGDRVGVVGINGTGKSTLLRVAAGADDPEEGRVVRGRGAIVGFLEQEPRLGRGRARDTVGSGWEADAVLDRLGMGNAADAEVHRLSGGQAKRVALASVLVHPVDLLVLDEPTNHLDLSAIEWLEHRLLDRRGALLLVSHDRHLLERVTTRMVELDRGRAYVHVGGYDSYLAARAEREERAATSEATRRNLARRELAWLRRGAPARTRKPQARIDSANALVSARAEAPARASSLDIRSLTPRLGDKVVECRGVDYGYDAAGPLVLRGVDLVLDPRERLGVVGANGSGKSTLLELLAGRRAPTAGSVESGPTAVVGFYDQRGRDLDPDARVQDVVAGQVRRPGTPEDVALMERFWFTGELPFARVRTLSGGERRRLQLLVVLGERPNVLLLDEPTNDFDLDTLRALEDFLDDWPGALVAVSHDRTFLERTTDRLVSVADDGRIRGVAGGVAAWVANHAAGAARTTASRAVPARGPVVRGQPERRGAAAPGVRGAAAPGVRGAAAAGVRGAAAPGMRGAAAPGAVARPPAALARELRAIEREIDRLRRRLAELGEVFGVAVGHDELARAGRDLAAVQAELDSAEERWLEVAEQAEASR